jgi:hypothetical protein
MTQQSPFRSESGANMTHRDDVTNCEDVRLPGRDAAAYRRLMR